VDPKVVAFIIQTLGDDGNAVFHAYDGRSAVELAFGLSYCDLVISNTRVDGMPGVDLIHQLRQRMPTLPVLYIANIGRSTPEIERQLPVDVPILREPFTADELRAAAGVLLDRDGAVDAWIGGASVMVSDGYIEVGERRYRQR
jgi:two-component system OmpR family response regulator